VRLFAVTTIVLSCVVDAELVFAAFFSARDELSVETVCDGDVLELPGTGDADGSPLLF
jgi:hypothetical protein